MLYFVMPNGQRLNVLATACPSSSWPTLRDYYYVLFVMTFISLTVHINISLTNYIARILCVDLLIHTYFAL